MRVSTCRHPLLSLLALAILLAPMGALVGCGGDGTPAFAVDPGTNVAPSVPDLAAVQTGDPQVPVVGIHRDGSTLAALADLSGRLQGGVFRDSSGASFTVMTGPDDRPKSAILADAVILYENWTSTTVDVAVVRSDGEITLARGVPTGGASPVIGSGFHSNDPSDPASTLRFLGVTLSVASCVAAVVLTAGAAALPCTAAIVQVAVALTPEDNSVIQVSGTAFGVFADAIGCAGGDPFSCGGLVVTTAEAILADGEQLENGLQDEIAVAEGALASGAGDVQVTLTWDTTADVDLHVTDPVGEEIYFGNPTSVSGGQLDVDDTDGFGPENVFWPQGGAPAGTYVVEVEHFSGASPTGYTVLVQEAGFVQSYEGTLFTNERELVVTFVLGQQLPTRAAGGSPIVVDPSTRTAKP